MASNILMGEYGDFESCFLRGKRMEYFIQVEEGNGDNGRDYSSLWHLSNSVAGEDSSFSDERD